jgi:hypothetical protein
MHNIYIYIYTSGGDVAAAGKEPRAAGLALSDAVTFLVNVQLTTDLVFSFTLYVPLCCCCERRSACRSDSQGLGLALLHLWCTL